MKKIVAGLLLMTFLLSGCSQDNKSFSEMVDAKKNKDVRSPSPSIWIPSGASESAQTEPAASETAQSKSSKWLTFEDGSEFDSCYLEYPDFGKYPNFPGISVGYFFDADGNKRNFLFDGFGKVRHIFDKDIYVASGFYDGMCLTNTGRMAGADGTLFWPVELSSDDVIIRYAKDDELPILWTVRREDSILGTKVVFTAWVKDEATSSLKVYFQFDTSQEEFEGMNADDIYKTMTENSGRFTYSGNGVYRIKPLSYSDRIVFESVYKGTSEASSKYFLEYSGGHGTILYLSVRNANLETLPGWNNIMSHRSGYPQMREGLIFMDAQTNEANARYYPAGFYDVNLNCVIDLSQYDIVPISYNDPCFMNGYAVLQMRNPDGVPFWGVLKKDGTWSAEPQKGTVRYVFPTADGVLISTRDENAETFQTYLQDGTLLSGWENNEFSGPYGYASEGWEVCDGYLYTNLSGHIAKIASDGSYEYLS